MLKEKPRENAHVNGERETILIINQCLDAVERENVIFKGRTKEDDTKIKKNKEKIIEIKDTNRMPRQYFSGTVCCKVKKKKKKKH